MRFFIFFLFIFISFNTIQNTPFKKPFKHGEKITYNIYYTVLGIYVHAGTATFSIDLTNYNNKPVYHIVGEGHSNKGYDWIFKVRDTYQSYIDTNTLYPYKFERKIEEGSFKKYELIEFNHSKLTAKTLKAEHIIPNGIQDVLSSIYFARNIDYSSLKPNERINFKMFLDDQIYDTYIKFIGKETITTKFGKFKAIHFKPLLLKGTIFSGGEKMNVWVTDDENHIPIRIETPIVVGSIKVDMMDYQLIKFPLNAKL